MLVSRRLDWRHAISPQCHISTAYKIAFKTVYLILMRCVYGNLYCNFKMPKRSQHQRLMSAAAPKKQLVDSRSLSLTFFTCLLRIVKAILSRFKQVHLAFPPAAENRSPRPTALYPNSRYNVVFSNTHRAVCPSPFRK